MDEELLLADSKLMAMEVMYNNMKDYYEYIIHNPSSSQEMRDRAIHSMELLKEQINQAKMEQMAVYLRAKNDQKDIH